MEMHAIKLHRLNASDPSIIQAFQKFCRNKEKPLKPQGFQRFGGDKRDTSHLRCSVSLRIYILRILPQFHCVGATRLQILAFDRAAILAPLSTKEKRHPFGCLFFGGDKRDRTADLLNAIQALSRLDRLHTPLNRANRAFNTRDTPPKAAKPSAFFLKFIIAGARPHINTKFENKLDTAIPFSHGIISLFHSERGC